jgi:flagellar hook-basal body complex protein FliE
MPLVPGIGAGVGGAGGIGGLGGAGEWQVGSIDGPAAPQGKSFGSVLSHQLQSLSNLQDNAATAAQSLADGSATDPTTVVMAVERARLAMQMASQLRTKGVEAINDIFHTQV